MGLGGSVATFAASQAQGSDDDRKLLILLIGEVAEWLKAPPLREYTLIAYRGFESLLLRHPNKNASRAEAFLSSVEQAVN